MGVSSAVNERNMSRRNIFRVGYAILVAAVSLGAVGKKPLTLQDMMMFRQIKAVVIAGDGQWVAYTANPDRGDGATIVRSTTSGREYRIPRGEGPAFSLDARWLGALQQPPAEELEKDKNPPAARLLLLDLASGDTIGAGSVGSFSLANNGQWVAYLKKRGESKDSSKANAVITREDIGTNLILRNLRTGKESIYPFVLSFAFDSLSHFLAFSRGDSTGSSNAVQLIDLTEGGSRTLDAHPLGAYENLTWNNRTGQLAFLRLMMGNDGKKGGGTLFLWSTGDSIALEATPPGTLPAHWTIPAPNSMSWSRDGKRLFLGLKPERSPSTASSTKGDAYFNIDSLRSKSEVDVWNWIDPLIIPNQKIRWKEIRDQTFTAVFDATSGSLVQLGDSIVPYISHTEFSPVALGSSDIPYRQEISWTGTFRDYYLVHIGDGSRTLIVKKQLYGLSLSPSGRYAVYYRDRQWYLYDVANDRTRVLTDSLQVPFYDTLDDHPWPTPGFGTGGWGEDDRFVFVNDMFDIWQIPTEGGTPLCITGGDGRRREVRYRVIDQHPDVPYFRENEKLLLSAYSERKKNTAFYRAQTGHVGVRPLLDEAAKFSFVGKAQHAPVVVFTRERYTEFPDLWVSSTGLSSPKKISTVNPQMKDFAWGEAELVSWNSTDGVPLQGVLIKPVNYEPGKRYPVLVFFYELSSQTLYDFNKVEINHRPCLPYLAGNGYAVFRPDVRYKVGEPGFSATKCVVPGVQKLIDMGIADPKAIALHGHSWGGYETAFMVTQTSMFAAAIAGAPVANMTSAYDGIRWESGLSRQFQYEQTQSRIGGSLWERRDRYIENSPVFFADRITTPLLIQFGDEDGAVPWYQGIEMYLAMRRLGKECYFLQYRGEPHHLKKYPNKVDYTIRFMEFLDHELKGAPAPDWMTRGVPYVGPSR